jgi:hypothetical protein
VDVLFSGSHSRTHRRDRVHALADRAWINTFGFWTPTDRSLLPVTTIRWPQRAAIRSISDARIEGTAKTG